MTPILELLLTESPAPTAIESLAQWWAQHRAIAERFEAPVDVALAAGFRADRLGYAFASGYQAAGAQLFGAHARSLMAFCVTEKGGAHPRAIATTLSVDGDGFRLDGHKRFVTLGPHATELMVVASTGLEGERNLLRVARIDPTRPGVEMSAAEQVPFVPEIPHAVVEFRSVRVEASELLLGDGYLRYVKPFRTVEDCHVHAALLAWLLQLARRAEAGREVSEAILARVVAIRALASVDPAAPSLHVALAGVLELTASLIARLEPILERLDDETRARWQRDRLLFEVASKARALRRDAAWRDLTH